MSRKEMPWATYTNYIMEQRNFVPSPDFIEKLKNSYACEQPMILNLFGFILHQKRHTDPSSLRYYKAIGPRWMQDENNEDLFNEFIEVLVDNKLIELESQRVSMTPKALEMLVFELALGKFESDWFAPYYGYWDVSFFGNE